MPNIGELNINGTVYAFTDGVDDPSGVRAVDLTLAQYEALSSAEQNNGTVYMITDLQIIYRNGIRYSNDAIPEFAVPHYDQSNSYVADNMDLVLNGGQCYRAMNDIAADSAWSSSDWQAREFSKYVTDLLNGGALPAAIVIETLPDKLVYTEEELTEGTSS